MLQPVTMRSTAHSPCSTTMTSGFHSAAMPALISGVTPLTGGAVTIVCPQHLGADPPDLRDDDRQQVGAAVIQTSRSRFTTARDLLLPIH